MHFVGILVEDGYVLATFIMILEGFERCRHQRLHTTRGAFNLAVACLLDVFLDLSGHRRGYIEIHVLMAIA